jgi:hypothetical protein
MIATLGIIFLCALIIGFFGRSYRFGFWGHFFVSIIFFPLLGILAPIVGLLVLLAGTSVHPREQNPGSR